MPPQKRKAVVTEVAEVAEVANGHDNTCNVVHSGVPVGHGNGDSGESLDDGVRVKALDHNAGSLTVDLESGGPEEKRSRVVADATILTCPTLDNGQSVAQPPQSVVSVLKGLGANNFSGNGLANRHCQFFAITHRAIPLVPEMYPEGHKWIPVKLTIVGCKRLGNSRAPHKLPTDGGAFVPQDGAKPLFEYQSRLSELGEAPAVGVGAGAGSGSVDEGNHSSGQYEKERVRELVKEGVVGDDYRGVVMYSWEKGVGHAGNRGPRSDDISVLVEIGDSFTVFLNDEDCCTEDPAEVAARNAEQRSKAAGKGAKGGKSKPLEKVNTMLPYPEAFGRDVETRIDPFTLLEITATTKNRDCAEKGQIWRCVNIRKATNVTLYSLLPRLQYLPRSLEAGVAAVTAKKEKQKYMRDLDERDPLFFVPEVLPTAMVCDDLQCTPCAGREFNLTVPSHVTNGRESALQSSQQGRSGLREAWPSGFLSLAGWSPCGYDDNARVDIPIDLAARYTNSKDLGFAVSLIQMAASMKALSLVVFTSKWWAMNGDSHSHLRAIPLVDAGKILRVAVDCIVRPSALVTEGMMNVYSFDRREMGDGVITQSYKFVTEHSYDDGQGEASKILVSIKHNIPSLRSVEGITALVVTGGTHDESGGVVEGVEEQLPVPVPCDDFLLSQPVFGCEKVIDVGISLKSESEAEVPALNATLRASKILQCAMGGGALGREYRRARIGGAGAV